MVPARLEPVSPPDALHRTEADAGLIGHRRAGPVRCFARRLLHGQRDDALGDGRIELRDARGLRLVAQKPVHAFGGGPLLPAPESAPSAPFIGLNNYKETLASPLFQQSLRNQLIFTAATIAVEITAGMGVAVLINGKLRGLRAARTLLLIPPMIAPAVVGLNFRWLFNSQYGFIDALLADLRLPTIPWLSDPHWALVSIIIADVWQNTPLMVLLFLAGLQSLPLEPLEAASVDGASPWQIFRHITLPLLRPVIMVALMLRIIDTFRTFDVVWLMTQGGPGGATSLITVHAYLLAFQGVDFGHAAAVSYIALVLSLLLLGVLYCLPWLRET
jgi:multiple sugar transport system permease protein